MSLKDQLRRLWQESRYAAVALVLRRLEAFRGGARGMFLPHLAERLPPGPWLVLAPHPDDETLGPGATIALAASRGIAAHVLVITDGAQGSEQSGDCGPALVRIRREEARRAGDVLGVKAIEFLPFPDTRLEAEALIDPLTERIARLAPATIFTPFPVDYHRDHVQTTVAAGLAVRALGWQGEIWLYEASAPIFPNTLVDVSATIQVKDAAMRLYVSQMAANDYLFSVVHGLNHFRTHGLLRGKGAAEAFFVTNGAGLCRLLDALGESGRGSA